MTVDIEDNLPGMGDIVAGKYRVDNILGRGGMGLVVGATHTLLDQKVAIKFLTAEAEGELLARFGREARAVAKLKSEYVARVFDVGELDNGTPYMVMEHLTGKDLGDVSKERGKLPVEEAVLYILQACHAVAEAHGVGIIHRDLKPSNLFLTTTPDGEDCVKVLDFGISKDTNAEPFSEGDGELTKTSMVLGTPYYMSPEQMRSARSVDARSDVWSIGAILYQLLTNDKPFRAASFPELVVKVLQEEPPPPTRRNGKIPVELEMVVLRCLEKSPDKRYANIAEFAIALAPFGPPAADALAERIARVVERATHVSLPAISKRHIPRGVTLPPGLSVVPVEVQPEAETVAEVGASSSPASAPATSASVSSRPPTNAALAPTMPSPGVDTAPGSSGFIRERRPGQELGTLTNASSVLAANEESEQPAGLKRPLMMLLAAAAVAAAIGVGLGIMNRGGAADGADALGDGDVAAAASAEPIPSDTATADPVAPTPSSEDAVAPDATASNPTGNNRLGSDPRPNDPALPPPATDTAAPEPTTPEPPPPSIHPQPSAKKPPPPPPVRPSASAGTSSAGTSSAGTRSSAARAAQAGPVQQHDDTVAPVGLVPGSNGLVPGSNGLVPGSKPSNGGSVASVFGKHRFCDAGSFLKDPSQTEFPAQGYDARQMTPVSFRSASNCR